jgi:hypothetical protein
MKQTINLELPVNNLSFGQVSTLFLKTIFERTKSNPNYEYDFSLFPIGNIDLSSQKVEEDFKQWINSLIIKGLESHKRDIPTFKLWHLQGSLTSLSNEQILLTFYELDNPTKIELNIANNQKKVLLTNNFACSVFKIFGVESSYIAPAFDSYNFSKLDKVFHTDGRIVFNLCGKFEKRKHHAKVIQSWIKKYGNNPKYALQCAIFNSFLTPEQNNQLIGQAIGGNKPFNVSFYPAMKENFIYNEFLNSADIIIGMSGGEGIDLPVFQSVGIGKHSVILNAHAYQDWANDENSVLLNPSGKEPVYDNMFFQQGSPYNQGNIFTWNEDEFIVGCEKAIDRVNNNKINTKGLELQQIFNKDKFVDSILEYSLK